MTEEILNKKIDTEKFGANNQARTEDIADQVDGQDQVEQPHDPFPARKSKQAAIKTYKDYAAESLQKGGGSLTKMIIAERDKKRSLRRSSGANPKNMALSVLSIVFVLLGLGTIVGAFFLVTNWQETEGQKRIPLIPQPLIIYDYRSELYIENPTRARIVREVETQINETGIEVGSLKYLYFSTDNSFGEKALMTAQELLEFMRAKVSASFSRSLDANFMYGVYSSTENAPFLIFKTKNYDTTYAEILAWERTMGLDIGALLGEPSVDYARSNFVDVVYYNRDSRAILNNEGEPVLGYSFIDKNTIVLFSNKLVLREIIDRGQQNTVKE